MHLSVESPAWVMLSPFRLTPTGRDRSCVELTTDTIACLWKTRWCSSLRTNHIGMILKQLEWIGARPCHPSPYTPILVCVLTLTEEGR